MCTETAQLYRYNMKVSKPSLEVSKPWDVFSLAMANYRTDTHTLSIGTSCTRSAEIAYFLSLTAPKHPKRSPTATNSFGTIKDTFKHQGKANASLNNNIMIVNFLWT
ncbi:hypothetical protein GQ457_17G014430 [Hibiscus cannabinus]